MHSALLYRSNLMSADRHPVDSLNDRGGLSAWISFVIK